MSVFTASVRAGASDTLCAPTPPPPAAGPALRAVITSPSHGALAREGARTALLDSDQ